MGFNLSLTYPSGRWAEGWTAGGAGPEQAAEFARRVREAWKQSGRKGDPRIVALTYFAHGRSADLDQIDRLAEAAL